MSSCPFLVITVVSVESRDIAGVRRCQGYWCRVTSLVLLLGERARRYAASRSRLKPGTYPFFYLVYHSMRTQRV